MMPIYCSLITENKNTVENVLVGNVARHSNLLTNKTIFFYQLTGSS